MKPEYDILKISKLLDAKKAEDIVIIDTSKITSLCDYIILATATSSTHVKSMAENVYDHVTLSCSAKEGYGESNWIVLDYGFAIVHMFTKELREYYNLEKLYSDGKFKKFATFEKDIVQKEKKAKKEDIAREKQAAKNLKAKEKKEEKIVKKELKHSQSKPEVKKDTKTQDLTTSDSKAKSPLKMEKSVEVDSKKTETTTINEAETIKEEFINSDNPETT